MLAHSTFQPDLIPNPKRLTKNVSMETGVSKSKYSIPLKKKKVQELNRKWTQKMQQTKRTGGAPMARNHDNCHQYHIHFHLLV